MLSLYAALSGDIYCDDNVAVEIVADTVVEDGVVVRPGPVAVVDHVGAGDELALTGHVDLLDRGGRRLEARHERPRARQGHRE